MKSKPPARFACRDLQLIYRQSGQVVVALENVSFEVQPHEFVCLVGPSGCGKTTLLKVMAGLLSPQQGTVTFGNGNVGYSALVFQEHGVFPWMTVLENVAFGLEMKGTPKPESHRLAGLFVEKVGLADFSRSYPHTLSVGMRQRIGIARALAVDPDLMLLDEPLAALDAQTKLVMQEELLKIWKENRSSVVYVTHDIEEAILLGDKILVMSGHPGRILETIPIPLERPRDLVVRNYPLMHQIKRHIWKLIETEVRKALIIPR